eukprot:PhM_4_TR6110/c0_g1_i1/m.59319
MVCNFSCCLRPFVALTDLSCSARALEGAAAKYETVFATKASANEAIADHAMCCGGLVLRDVMPEDVSAHRLVGAVAMLDDAEERTSTLVVAAWVAILCGTWSHFCAVFSPDVFDLVERLGDARRVSYYHAAVMALSVLSCRCEFDVVDLMSECGLTRRSESVSANDIYTALLMMGTTQHQPQSDASGHITPPVVPMPLPACRDHTPPPSELELEPSQGGGQRETSNLSRKQSVDLLPGPASKYLHVDGDDDGGVVGYQPSSSGTCGAVGHSRAGNKDDMGTKPVQPTACCCTVQ